MKISTWNIYSRNPDQVEALRSLLAFDMDVMCLQELRQETLNFIYTLPDVSVNACESQTKRGALFFNAIVSRVSPLKTFNQQLNLRAPQTFLSQILGLTPSLKIQYNDYLTASGKTLRLFNLHLPYPQSPDFRLWEMNKICDFLSPGFNIICGDFNSFGHFPWNFITGPLCSYPAKNYVTNELNRLEELANSHNLKLSLKDSITYPRCGTHLDHILIPASWQKFNAKILNQRFGSDHRIVVLEEQETFLND